jgi:hypothetical protein
MSVQDDIRQDLRAWLQSACGIDDSQVILADEPGPRPELPYLTVKILSDDAPLGADEDVYAVVDNEGDEELTQAETGVRTGTASVQGFGADTADWLQASGLLRLPSTAALLDAAGLTLRALGGVRNLSTLLDTSIEPRFIREFEFSYRWTSEAEVIVAAGTAETTGDSELRQYDGDPDPLPFPLSEPLEP